MVLVITCYVLAAAMEHLNISSLDQIPAEEVVSDAAELWALPAKQHEEKLDSISSEIVKKFIPCEFNCTLAQQKDQVKKVIIILNLHHKNVIAGVRI